MTAARSMLALVLSLVAAYTTGAIGSLFTIAAIPAWYATLARPALSPPNQVFAPVWTTLYIFMAVAAWRVWQLRGRDPRVRSALAVYGAHLVVNALWSVVFFGLRSTWGGVAVILVLLGLILYLTDRFFRIDRAAGWLFVPYLAWVLFATYLNISIAFLN